MAGATVTKIITVNAGDHHILQFQRGNGVGEVFGFVHIEGVGAAMAPIAEGAVKRGFVSHDHEGGSALATALATGGGRSFFAPDY